jgi:methylmalonyl-CoA mutase cobalamin-binding subunit
MTNVGMIGDSGQSTQLATTDSSDVARRPLRVLLSSVASDAHTWNLVFLQLLLEEHGCEVVNLGACVPDEMLIDRCRAEMPDVVVISTVNGHGYLDGMRLIRRLRADEVGASMRVVIGGKLGIDDNDDKYGESLVDAGFDAAVTGSSTARLTDYLDQVGRQALHAKATHS